ALNTRGAFGHIAHTREVSSLDAGMIDQMREKTRAVAAYIDRKAIPGRDLARLEDLLAERRVKILSEGELMHIGDLSWETYMRVLSLAEQIVPGCRVTLHGQSPGGEPVRIDLDPVLLEEAWRLNQKGFL